jgi:CO dehydrogenase/acetyl-CoA synthase gamma subunit (corrinoid Fe-S protein)
MGIKADLYLDRIDPLRYFNARDCRLCGATSCGQWLERIAGGRLDPATCPALEPHRRRALETVLSLDRLLPEVEATQHPLAGPVGYHAVNDPTTLSPVLVTGNAVSTQEVLLAVLATTTAPFHLLFVDCLGHTVDMAMVYGVFSAQRVCAAIERGKLASRVSHRDLIVPGLTAPVAPALAALTGWTILVGPICAGELPLFLGPAWTGVQEP